jgi:cysteinyl-tRNA synthetase
MISLIQSLIDRSHAYEAAGEVLFDTKSMADYGQLSKRPLDEQQAGARVEVDAHKKSPGDFVLWKQSSDDEPGWPASFRLPDGSTKAIRGRPGWHIECSAMSAAYLGEVFDIHGGGLDLIFPHHENEIAQSRCAHGTDVMANYWMHNGFLQVEGQKMSKSLGNFYAINELLETESFGGRKWPGEVLRLAMLMTHYREPIDFSVRKLEEAENIIRRWGDALSPHNIANNPHDAPKILPEELVDALSDDLGFSRAIAPLHELAGAARSGDAKAATLLAAAVDFLGLRRHAWDANDQALLFNLATDDGLNRKLDQFIAERLAFIAAKDWASADRIRDELLAQGIQLKDGKDPATGERITTWEVKR